MNINIIGSKYHCDMVKNLLAEEKSVNFVSNIEEADLLYVIYGPGVNKRTLKYWIFDKRPILIHWIGKDTFLFKKKKSPSSLLLKAHRLVSLILIKYRRKRKSIKFLSSAPWLAEEITTNTKIDTEYLVLTSIENDQLLAPRKIRDFDILSYIPVKDFDMYYGNDLLELIKLNPNYKFCIVCPDLMNNHDWPFERYENLVIQPRTDKSTFMELLNNSKNFLRLKDGGDAIALSVLEALAHGTRVIWNVEFDYCDFETRESFKDNIKHYLQSKFEINYDAVEYVKKNYDVEKWKNDFIKVVYNLNKLN